MIELKTSRKSGFTLIELLIVMVIIGLLISLIMVAAQEGIRRAEDRATQSLISKLENALNDRVQAVMSSQVDPNAAHLAMASIYVPDPAGIRPFIALDTIQGQAPSNARM